MKAVQLFCIIIVVTRGIIIQTNHKEDEEKLSNPLVTLFFNKSVNINQGTVCLKFYLLGNLGKYILLSTTSGRTSFSIYFVMEDNYGFIYFPKKSFLFVMPNIWPFEWFHFCFAYNNDGYHIITNGKIWDSRHIPTKHDDLEDYFIERFTISSLNNGEYLFPGRFSGLNIWNHTLTIDDLMIITTSCSELLKQPNILKWSMVNKNQFAITNNNLCQFVNPKEDMCSSENIGMFKLYLTLANYEDATNICKFMNAELYFPKDKDDLTKIRNESSGSYYYKHCNHVWLPINQNDDEEWVDTSSKQVLASTDLPWRSGEPNGGGRQRCVFTTPSFTFVDLFCSSSACPICKWNKNPVFFLKGLCSHSKIEYRYVLKINELYQGNLAFHGFSNNYYILYDVSRQAYILTRSIDFNDQETLIHDNKIIAMSLSSKTNNAKAIGLQTWKINEEICDQQTIQLKLTYVRFYF